MIPEVPRNEEERERQERMINDLIAASETDLSHDPVYSGRGGKAMHQFLANPFLSVFTALRDLRARGDSEAGGHLGDNQQSEITNEQSELKGEQPEGSEELLHRLMDTILVYFPKRGRGRVPLCRYAFLFAPWSFSLFFPHFDIYLRATVPKHSNSFNSSSLRQCQRAS